MGHINIRHKLLDDACIFSIGVRLLLQQGALMLFCFFCWAGLPVHLSQSQVTLRLFKQGRLSRKAAILVQQAGPARKHCWHAVIRQAANEDALPLDSPSEFALL